MLYDCGSSKAMKMGRYLQKKRQAVGYSVRQLGDKAGVCYTYISKLELGQRKPTIDKLHRILKALGVPWVDFLEATGYIKKPRPRRAHKPYLAQ